MKVHVDIDCTPEEARAFFGLPDVQPVQAAVMKELENRLMAGMQATWWLSQLSSPPVCCTTAAASATSRSESAGLAMRLRTGMAKETFGGLEHVSRKCVPVSG